MQISNIVGRTALRDILIAVVITTLVALSWLSMAGGGVSGQGPVRQYYLYILAYSYIIILLPTFAHGWRLAKLFSILVGLVVVIALATDLTMLRFFGSPFLKLYPYLPVTAANVSLSALAGYAASYISLIVWLVAGGTVLTGAIAARLLQKPQRARMTVIVLLPLFYLTTTLFSATVGRPDRTIAELMAIPPKPLQQLRASDRSQNFTLSGTPRAEPGTIIFVIMESTSATAPASSGKGLLSQAIIDESRVGRWLRFPNAVTNSNATDISVPSLLTGSGAHEPIEKIQALPFVSQYAAARGYRTAFITSSTLHWAGFEAFLSKAKPDDLVTAENSGLPFVNDLAVDDHFAYRSAANAIEKTDGKLFLTLYPQALHWPSQMDSAFAIPPHIRDRRARATFIAEEGFRLLFDTLRKTGRLEDSMIIVVGDHGEFDPISTLRMRRTRVDTFEGGILSPIFFLKAPASLPEADYRSLAGNSGKLVANLDIAPTLADMLGGELANHLSYDGQSLLRPVPDGRVAYSTSTNDWRHWTTAAIAVSRGDQRMTCDKNSRCRISRANGANLVFERDAKPDDALFALAMQHPVLRRALGQIYRTYYD